MTFTAFGCEGVFVEVRRRRPETPEERASGQQKQNMACFLYFDLKDLFSRTPPSLLDLGSGVKDLTIAYAFSLFNPDVYFDSGVDSIEVCLHPTP